MVGKDGNSNILVKVNKYFEFSFLKLLDIYIRKQKFDLNVEFNSEFRIDLR